MIPPSEDWEAATSKVFPASFAYTEDVSGINIHPARDLFTASNLAKFECAWIDKKPIAFFRGTATGIRIVYNVIGIGMFIRLLCS